MTYELKAKIDDIENVNFGEFSIEFDHANIINSRDIEELIVELTDEYQGLLNNLEDLEGNELEEAEENLENWIDELANEYVSLLSFKEEVDAYTSEWYDGATIIQDSYFESYARELAEDCGMIDRNASWPNNFIDWDAACDALKADYSEITFDGISYWVRG